MTYSLTFIRTTDGYLKVTASAKGAPTLTATYLNPDVLVAAARIANVSEEEIFDLNCTAKRAWENVGLDVCCEAIDLKAHQLESLGFGEDWKRLAQISAQ
jgi:hypothetical protein